MRQKSAMQESGVPKVLVSRVSAMKVLVDVVGFV